MFFDQIPVLILYFQTWGESNAEQYTMHQAHHRQWLAWDASVVTELLRMADTTVSHGDPILEENFVVLKGRNSYGGIGTLYSDCLIINLHGNKCMGRWPTQSTDKHSY